MINGQEPKNVNGLYKVRLKRAEIRIVITGGQGGGGGGGTPLWWLKSAPPLGAEIHHPLWDGLNTPSFFCPWENFSK